MLFQEIYGKYYHTVTKILLRASDAPITGQELRRIVSESAFSESGMFIPDALRSRWHLLKPSGRQVLKHPPSLPVSLLEKRWLKALLLDPRIRLFQPPEDGLEDVQPLFTPDLFVRFDRYGDGDPFTDPDYIRRFRLLSDAIAQNRKVRILYEGRHGELVHFCIPRRLEYSEKDDKFRLQAVQDGHAVTLNLGRIRSCALLEPAQAPREVLSERKQVILELVDTRNALERAMLHFSDLEKQTVCLAEGKYRLTLWYEPRDERELLIRVLSFGPMVKVLGPEPFLSQIKYRIRKQKNLRAL